MIFQKRSDSLRVHQFLIVAVMLTHHDLTAVVCKLLQFHLLCINVILMSLITDKLCAYRSGGQTKRSSQAGWTDEEVCWSSRLYSKHILSFFL